MQDRPRFGVAIPVSDEAQNIEALLDRVAAARPVRILVVSDASTDGTDALVRGFAKRSPVPVALQTASERRGKADAVNRILAAMPDVGIVVMVSGDAMPVEGCLERLVAAFEDATVGVAAGRPVPEGPDGNPAVEVSRLLWTLHHRIALAAPKSSEITAFRTVLPGIDPASRTDEAAIEQALTSRGYRVVYVPEALIRTNCPLSLRDYVKQRTRVTLGHLALEHETGYGVGTLSWRRRVRALGDVWREQGVKPSTLALAALLESGVYGAAWLRHRLAPVPRGIWSRSDSTKRSFKVRAG